MTRKTRKLFIFNWTESKGFIGSRRAFFPAGSKGSAPLFLLLIFLFLGACRSTPRSSVPDTSESGAAFPCRMSPTESTDPGTLSGGEWIDYLRRYPLKEIPPNAMRIARQEKSSTRDTNRSIDSQTVPGNSWRPIGPAPINFQFAPLSGRVRSIAIDQSDPAIATFYVGAATGGVWKTINGGDSWTPLTDQEDSLVTGSIAVDPDDSSIIYVGTGEYGGPYAGVGILRSIDGGLTWTREGSFFAYGTRISKLVLNPTHLSDPLSSRMVYAANENGLFRSSDSGIYWTRVWSADPNRGVSDVVIDPDNPSVVYLGARSPDSDQAYPPVYRSDDFGDTWIPVPGGELPLPQLGYGRINLAASGGVVMVSMEDVRNKSDLKGIWISTDSGATWRRINGHPPEFGEWSLVSHPDLTEIEPDDSLGQAQVITPGQVVEGTLSSGSDGDFYRFHIGGNEMSFEICADRVGAGFNPRLRLYDSSGTEYSFSPIDSAPGKGVQGSDDERMSPTWSIFEAGDYYLKVESADGLLLGSGDYQLSVIASSLGCQCGYDQVVAIHPENPDIMYWGGVRLFRTDDGGLNWSQIQDHNQPAVSSNWIHADVHTVAISEREPDFMLWGTDGGIFATTNAGDSWESRNTNLAITQFYQGISQHPTDPGFVLGGTQDNAVPRYRQDSWEWPPGEGGDGGFTAIDPDDPTQKTWYGSAQNMALWKTIDDGVHTFKVVSGLDRDNVAFVSPFVMDPNDARTLLAAGGKEIGEDTNVFEHYVYRSTDGAASWQKNSPDLGHIISAIAIAPSDSEIYYAGTIARKVWASTGTGSNWTDVTGPEFVSAVTNLAVDPHDPRIVYATFGGFGRSHVFRSEDSGGSWTNIGDEPFSAMGLPSAPVWSLVVDPQFPDTLFVSGDLGIFKTVDGGVHWQAFDNELPNVPVFDLDINATTLKMRAATFGRSMWELTQANDSCYQAEPISNGVLYSSTTNASVDGEQSCALTEAGPDVWYTYTAPYTGELLLNTCGSELDTLLSVHDFVCPADTTTELPGGCNDDCPDSLPGCGPRDSCLTVPISAGGRYLINISGYNGASGDFALDVDSRRPIPVNDDCGSVSLPRPGVYHGWTTRASNDGVSSCPGSTGSPDVWYQYTADCDGTVSADLCGADFDTILSAHTGCPGTVENELSSGCNDDCGGSPCSGLGSCLSFPVQSGDTYELRVSGYEGAVGEFDITLSCIAANDTCATAIPVGDGIRAFSTLSVTTDPTGTNPECSFGEIGKDIWYVYNSPVNSRVTVDTCDSEFDTRIAVYPGGTCPPAAGPLACSDDACGSPDGLQSRLSFDASAGQDYLIRVGGGPLPGGYLTATGVGNLHIVSEGLETIIFSDGFESGNLATWDLVTP